MGGEMVNGVAGSAAMVAGGGHASHSRWQAGHPRDPPYNVPPLLCVAVPSRNPTEQKFKKIGFLGQDLEWRVCGCARGWVGVRGCAWVRRRASACVCVCAAVQSSKDAWLGLSTLSLEDIKVLRCER